MTSKPNKTVVIAVIILLTAGAVVWDSYTPLGVADWVWYFIPLVLSIYVGGRFFTFALAAALSLLILAGFYLSPPGIDPHLAFLGRLMGVVVQWLVAFMIAQRKQAEVTLRQTHDELEKRVAERTAELSQERRLLRTLIDNLPDCVYVKDSAGRKILANPADLKNLRCKTEAEAFGKSDFDFFPKEVAEKFWADDQKVIHGEPVINREELTVNDEDEKYWQLTSKLPLRDQAGKIVGLVGIGRNITRQKQAEEALHQSRDELEKRIAGRTADLAGANTTLQQQIAERERIEHVLDRERLLLRTLIDNLPDCIYAKDATGRKILANPADLKNLRCKTEAEAIGKSDFDFFPKDIAERFWADDQKVIHGEAVINREEYFLNDGGGKRWLLTSKLPLRDQTGKIAGLMGIGRDITERKQAEERLAEALDFNQKIISEAPEGILVFKAPGQCVLANEAAARTLNGTVPALIKQNFRQIESWRVSGMLKMAEETLAAKSPRSGEFRFTSTFGKEAWLDCHFSFFVRNNEPHLLLLFNDVIERKHAEEHVREQAALLRTLIDLLPETFYIKDLDGRFLIVNEALVKQFGRDNSSQVLGRTDTDFFPPGLAAEFRAEEIRVFAGEPVIDRNSICVFADGREHAVLTTKLPFRDSQGRICGLVGIGHDITDLKLAEEHVREQAALLDKAQDAIMVMDMDSRIIYWNKSAERIYGWSAAEALGQTPLKLFLGGAISPRHAAVMKAVKERGEWSGELQETTKDGKTITVQGRCNVIRDAEGRSKARLVINTDITERKILEAQFLRSQRMESLGTLAGGIAHDLNNVLTPLLVAVQVLKEKVTDADGKRLLESLETNVQRGASLVKQVLAFGRGMEGERIVVQPKHIAREIRQFVNETFPKSVQFELQCAANLWTITGDPTQLHQVLLNLCVNARDAMPKGGKLSLHLDNVTLDEAYASMNLEAQSGPHLCITVEDNGTGIPKEIQEKIFDPFFTTKEPGKGTGLGLSTTLAIVKSHGGFIHCQSAPGKGSTFKVYLPANATQAGAENVVAGETKLLHGHNELVLVVDDEEPIRKLAQRALERYGYRVLLAADGVEALSIYKPRQNEIDVVITDMVMPNMDGLATINALKSINPEIKIVGSSGMASDGGVTKALNAGIKHFVPKPYTAETMLTALHDVLNGKH